VAMLGLQAVLQVAPEVLTAKEKKTGLDFNSKCLKSRGKKHPQCPLLATQFSFSKLLKFLFQEV
jgi:hypothetical protein